MRDAVVNLDSVARFGVTSIRAPGEAPGADWIILADINRSVNGAVLGRYKSAERAKGVLRDILTEYQRYIFSAGGLVRGDLYAPPWGFNPPKAYTMPEA